MTTRRLPSPLAIASTLLAPLLFATPSTAQLFPDPPPPPCDEWGTGYFFRSATPERVRECLEAGADPVAPNPDGVTPLHLAALQNRNPEIVTILVEAGADPNARGPSGLTPLHMSWSQSGSTRAAAVARELLRLGADPLARDERGWVADPTHCDHWNTRSFSRIAVRADFARCLEEGADVFARDANFPYANDGGYTVLHHATANGDATVIALLVEAGADLEARNDRWGFTPLHTAIGNRNVAAVTALLDAGADIEADAGGIWGTPLSRAAMQISGSSNNRNAAKMAIIDALLAAGADVNAVGEDGRTPLLNVLQNGRIGLYSTNERLRGTEATADSVVDLAVRLLEAGADPDAPGGWGQTPLHEAAEYRTPALVQALLDAGADPNATDRYGSSALHVAARAGSPEIIALLVAAGAEVDGRTEVGTSPIHVAVSSVPYDLTGDSPQVRTGSWRLRATALLEAGADPNLPDAEGDTPLHLAAQEVDTALVSVLATAGADLNARNDRGETPLLTARNHANVPVARKLLDLGAAASVLEGTGGIDGPLCDLNDSSFLRRAPAETLRDCLEAGFPVNTPGDFGLTPLMRLASSGPGSFDEPEKVALLLAAGADPNASRESGRTPLHLVVEARWDYEGHRKWAGTAGRTAATALLDAGADVNARDTQGQTPLHEAVRQEDDSAMFMVTLLIEAGADANARANDGQTPLHLAASLGHTPVMSALLDAGAEVDARTIDGLTPLHLALRRGQRAAATILLEAGADPDARDAEGNPVDPTDCEHWGTGAFFVFATADIVESCLDAGADPNTLPERADSPDTSPFAISFEPPPPLHAAAAHARDPAVITAMVRAGADVNARGDWDNTPLHEAAENGTPGVVRALLEAGADVNARPRGFHPSSGVANTPLHFAARNPDPQVAAALLEAGADVNARGQDRTTPLHYAASNRNPAVAELLLEAGAEVNAGGSDGITPLHNAAARNSNPDVLAVLLEAGADVHARGAYNHTHAPAGQVTPLHTTAYWNTNPEVVTMLIAAGADPDGGEVTARPPAGPDTFIRLGDFRAQSPIFLAASINPNPAVIEALVRAGADLERTGPSGHTVLHDAANYIPRAFPLLLRLGADPEARDAEGRTPMDFARENPVLQPWERVRMSTPLGRR